MDSDLLRSFVAFAECGSFNRAADRIGRTPSAFSMQMKRLEDIVGNTLFEREGRNVLLTADGITFVGYARRMLSLQDEAMGKMRGQDSSRPIRIGCPDDYTQKILPVVLRAIRKTYPDAKFFISVNPTILLHRMLDQGELDISIISRSEKGEEGYFLRHEPGVWVSSPIHKQHLANPLSLVLPAEDCKFHAWAIDAISKADRPFTLFATTRQAASLLHLVRDGLGVAALAAASVTDEFQILESRDGFPPLPAVGVALMLSDASHPLVDRQLAATIQSFVSEYINDDNLTIRATG
ncbi:MULTISPECIES: LysR family transcriptional regulator [Thalassospira]|uniref:Transcriptional regulator n=1 Tax=Thalassospira xiamenensis TaxID=220697 RepID=A0A367X9S7_9PROT|nr:MULTISPECIES: LysR family transcriptional regulator [Thalassospira]KZB52829.1 transcriptional regulator [Thalassospira xiamenensis]MBO9507132.1 LysR family transcriptional regulator [Thalassospira sp. A3_1]MCK2168702.1 LysR family transcriptional regulator [Thalassospira xiamenensis]RCK50423.1 transcriptional regulator [Thalassospira xiamenensis]